MIIIDLGDDYFLRGSRERVGSFSIVAIDWEHPNYGYFADAMLWYKSPHRINWVLVPSDFLKPIIYQSISLGN